MTGSRSSRIKEKRKDRLPKIRPHEKPHKNPRPIFSTEYKMVLQNPLVGSWSTRACMTSNGPAKIMELSMRRLMHCQITSQNRQMLIFRSQVMFISEDPFLRSFLLQQMLRVTDLLALF